MARPPKRKVVGKKPLADYLKPRGIPLKYLEENSLTMEEVEAMRLADKEGCYQEDAANQMGISRQTFQRLLKKARYKVADALMNGKAVHITGGRYVTPEGGGRYRCGYCGGEVRSPTRGRGPALRCPTCDIPTGSNQQEDIESDEP